MMKRKLEERTASIGAKVTASSMKSQNCESSSLPVTVSMNMSSSLILRILRILSSVISIFLANVLGSASIPVS